MPKTNIGLDVYFERDPVATNCIVVCLVNCTNDLVIPRKIFERIFGKIRIGSTYHLTGQGKVVSKKTTTIDRETGIVCDIKSNSFLGMFEIEMILTKDTIDHICVCSRYFRQVFGEVHVNKRYLLVGKAIALQKH